MARENAYMAYGRFSKARKLLALFDRFPERFTADELALVPMAWWCAAAKRIGVNTPSVDTVAEVIEMARELELERVAS